MCSAGILVIALSVDVVELHAKTNLLASIHGKESFQMVFASIAGTASVETDVRNWRKSIREKELIWLCEEEVVRMREHEIVANKSVDEDAIYSRTAHISEVVVLSVQTICEDGILEKMRKRVWLGFNTIAEIAVNSPHLQAFREILLGMERVALAVQA